MLFSWCSVWLFLAFISHNSPDKREQGRGSRQQDLKEQGLSRAGTTGGGVSTGGTTAKQQTATKSVFMEILLLMMDYNLCFIQMTWQSSVRCCRAARSAVSVSRRVSVFNGFSLHVQTNGYIFFLMTLNNFFFILPKVGNLDFQNKDMQISFS